MEDPLALMVTGYGNPYCHDAKPRWWKPEEHESVVGLGPDAFHVDDLLEFSNEVIGGPIGGVQASGQSLESSVTFAETMSHQSVAKGKQQSLRLSDEEQHAKDLGLDYNEIAELDWLSNFVEESYSTREHMDYMSKELLSVAAEKHPEMRKPPQDTFGRSSPHAISESSTTSARETSLSSKVPVPGRARSKRCSRSGSRVWSSTILGSDPQALMEEHTSMQDMPIFAESFLSFDYSALSADSEFILTQEESAGMPPVKKYFKPCKGKKLGQNGSSPRRCAHCLSQHTPQWRAGPAGPKTLCNACGVRYKSGRLLPEYRPAGSPTFMAHAHSNSHRKVLEMRKQKEVIPHRDEQNFNTRADDCFLT